MEPFEKNLKLSNEIRKKTNNVYTKVSNYDREIFINILNDYSKSLALAPKESEEYAMALGNRSAVLLSMLKFKECIIDINAALQITKDSVLKFKLLCRKIECLANLGNKNQIKEYYEEALKIAQSLNENIKNNCLKKLSNAVQIKPRTIPDDNREAIDVKNVISDAISWKYNEKYGNHLVANRDIEVGEKLIIEDSYCSYPELKKLYIVCSNCLQVTLNGIPCEHCVHVIFCSETCKKVAWEKFHDMECKIHKNFYKTVSSSSILECRNFFLTIRFLVMGIKENNGIEGLIKKSQEIDDEKAKSKTVLSEALVKDLNKNFNYCYRLLISSRVKKTDVYLLKIYEAFCNYVLISLEKSNLFDNQIIASASSILKKIINNLFLIIDYNSEAKVDFRYFNYKDLESIQLGICLVPTMSLINHSCAPNLAHINTKDSKCINFATKPIKKNEQLFICYNDGLTDDERHKYLLEVYNFKCECVICRRDINKAFKQGLNITDKDDSKRFEIYQNFKPNYFYNKNYSKLWNLKKEAEEICKAIKKGNHQLSEYDAAKFLKLLDIDFYKIYDEMHNIDIKIPEFL